jgi:hypothetical protein
VLLLRQLIIQLRDLTETEKAMEKKVILVISPNAKMHELARRLGAQLGLEYIARKTMVTHFEDVPPLFAEPRATTDQTPAQQVSPDIDQQEHPKNCTISGA